MWALYAFLRIADDISDEPADLDQKRQRLTDWRFGLEAALAGAGNHIIHPALGDIVRRYRIPPVYFFDALDGVEMDLTARYYESFSDLENYCYRVASVVGLSCIHIWGFQGERATEYAIKAGIAFQLTNILRDLAEDAARDRVYLPREDLARFAYTPDGLRQGVRDHRFRELMRFQIARTRWFYDAAWPLVPLLQSPGRAVFLVMARTYRALLDVIEQCDYDVFSTRIRVAPWRKLAYSLAALPARLGW
jgi:phytoene synthase